MKIGDRLSVAILLDNLGTNARGKGDLTASLQYHQQAYQIKKDIGDEVGLRMTRNSLAATLKRLGKPAEAISILEEALGELNRAAGVLEWWQVLLQLGRLHREIQDWDMAKDYYALALEMAQAAEYPKGVSMCERGIGLCFEGEGQLTAAHDHVARAVEISRRLSDPYLSNLLKDLQRIQEALAAVSSH